MSRFTQGIERDQVLNQFDRTDQITGSLLCLSGSFEDLRGLFVENRTFDFSPLLELLAARREPIKEGALVLLRGDLGIAVGCTPESRQIVDHRSG